jgi:recombination protein RecA
MPRAIIDDEPLPEREGAATYLPSGSALLDMALGGGWAEHRIINIVGDKSTGKTLLAIEACAGFAQRYGKKRIRYCEAEAAFDEDYAESIGMPEGIDYVRNIDTVEGWFDDIKEWLESNKSNEPCLYILDSLDALSDETEMEADMTKGSYGMGKAKMLSQSFRRLVRALSNSKCTLIIISQIRDKIGVMFGETKTRSGGRALDFYASQIVWLAELGKTKVTVRGLDRVTGIEVKATCKKNKVGTPHRIAEFIIRFGYGIDDEISLANFLKDAKVFDKAAYDNCVKSIKDARSEQDRVKLRGIRQGMKEAAWDVWKEIEDQLAPPMRKYE